MILGFLSYLDMRLKTMNDDRFGSNEYLPHGRIPIPENYNSPPKLVSCTLVLGKGKVSAQGTVDIGRTVDCSFNPLVLNISANPKSQWLVEIIIGKQFHELGRINTWLRTSTQLPTLFTTNIAYLGTIPVASKVILRSTNEWHKNDNYIYGQIDGITSI